jgi:SulP family sulfate permease
MIKSGSFDSRLREKKQKTRLSPWTAVSPMTSHLIREPVLPSKLKRRRSRSFNDYIDPPEDLVRFREAPNGLLLPPLKERPEAQSVTNKMEAQQSSSISTEEEEGNPIWVCVMYGLINATIVLPVLMSFGSIIYRNDAFQPYMPVLIKLTLVSGVVHQLTFSTLSSLPFAIGQVQDAGLIFLSKMATDMVVYCRNRNLDDETLLATCTIGLALCTAILGVGLIIVGKLRLAGHVQMLPTCVVGGYLAFIGWFCGESALTLMVGASELTLPILKEKIMFVLPGVLGGIAIYSSFRVWRHIAVLPTSIIVLLVLFYTGLMATGSSIEQATERGWIMNSEPAPVWYHTWNYLKLNKVVWSALPQLVMTELSMIFVVALSSSIDVAAIELELNQPLNYNRELTMVGISNVVSGLTGGYTGSYIFSQSIFSLRAGIRSRLMGYVVALCEVAVVMVPFPILSYVPNFFYGSLLSMICVDLMYEWLWEVRSKLTGAEYLICLATFCLIHILGVEYGIIAGVVVYAICYKLGINVGEVKIAACHSEEEGSTPTEKLVLVTEEEEEEGRIYETPATYGTLR